MRMRTLVLSAFATTIMSPVAIADDSYKIVDKPLERARLPQNYFL